MGTTLAQSIDMEPKSSVDFAALRKRVGSEGPAKSKIFKKKMKRINTIKTNEKQ